tara:strand:- start:329 stop:1048 length:720 start_codon:yes stop_codon:yes gene_type:complete
MKDTVVIIPIRLKASRFPNKPFAKIGDLPMFHYIYKRVSDISKNLFLAICDQEIKEYCEEMKLKYLMTDPNHMSGSDRIGEAVKKLDKTNKFEYVINVQGDMPFINANHLNLLKEKLLKFQISTLACPFVSLDEAKNSSKVKVTINQRNYASDFSRILNSNLKINQNVFHHIGVYAYHKKYLLDFISLPPTKRELEEKLEQLRIINTDKIGISIINEEILGVDTKEDLDRVNRLILKNE